MNVTEDGQERMSVTCRSDSVESITASKWHPKWTLLNSFGSRKRFCKFIRCWSIDFNRVASLKVDGKKLINDLKLKADLSTTSSKACLHVKLHSTSTCRTRYLMQNILISTSGVQLLANLQPSKAAGSDNLSPRVLKELSDVLANPLAGLFHKSLASGQIYMQ